MISAEQARKIQNELSEYMSYLEGEVKKAALNNETSFSFSTLCQVPAGAIDLLQSLGYSVENNHLRYVVSWEKK